MGATGKEVSAYTITLTTENDLEYRSSLQAILRAHNLEVAGIASPKALPLLLRIVDAHGTSIGGLVAATYWTWFVLDVMAIEPSWRGQGLGTQLLLRAEEEARNRGCTRAHTSTYPFQALRFYQHHGYTIVGQLDNYPEGATLYWLAKSLA